MKLTATVMSERHVGPYANSKPEPFALADLLVDGDCLLIAATLRALADALDPPSEQIADWEKDLLRRDALERRLRAVDDTS